VVAVVVVVVATMENGDNSADAIKIHGEKIHE
jgi:hypothetical protein